MSWNPKYVFGKLSIVADDTESVTRDAMVERVREIETSIGKLLARAEDEGSTQDHLPEMLEVFAKICGLFGWVSFTIGAGQQPDPDRKAKFDAERALDAKLNAELDAARAA